MSVNTVNAKLYGDYRADSQPEKSEKSENSGFDAVVDAAVKKASAAPDCRACVRVVQPEVPQATAESVADAGAVSGAETTGAVDETATEETAAMPEAAAATGESQEVYHTAMYRFTMYVRISGDFGSLQQSLVDEFKDATRGFVSALKGESQYGIEALDGYLGKAETVADNGLESSKAFLDEILAAADKGLKAVTSSLTSSAWSSGLNLAGTVASSLSSMFSSSSSSNSLFSSSSLDMVKLQLQSAMEDSLKTGSSKSDKVGEDPDISEMVDYGSGYQLAKINATPDLKLVDAEEASKADSVESSDKEVVEDSSSTGMSATGWLVRRDAVLDKFLQLIDSLSSSLGGNAQIVRAGFSFSMDKGIFANHMESGKAVENVDNSGSDTKEDDSGTAGETEEIVV